jgi:hypothetical protein
MHPHYAIIVGELAESAKVRQDLLGKIPDLIRSASTEVNRHLDPGEQIHVEIIRMDQFIGKSESPATALKSLLMLASQFRFSSYRSLRIRKELRLSLGLGPVEYEQQQLRESDGTAIRAAAEGLEGMKRNQRLSIRTPERAISEEFEVSCYFMDILIHDWSDEQAEAVFLSLTGMNQMQISEVLGISQPAVNRRLKAAHHDAILKFIDRYEKLIRATH